MWLRASLTSMVILLSACVPSGSMLQTGLPPFRKPATTSRPPLFAYYYIWFDPNSWLRAKSDYPRLGMYSSDDEAVMRQHIRWAKDAGIDGFIVGWKSTAKLDSRLDMLLRLSDAEQFKILIIYQALDFSRQPLPIEKIESDLDLLIATRLTHPSLQVFDKPVVIWSGTWKFTANQIAKVTDKRRDRLRILSSAKSIKDYQRVAQKVDGNAYYWSSVNVDTNPNYESKLKTMASAVRENNGIWIAPAAPGFDARAVGGTQVIDRKDGETLRQQLSAAAASSPNAIGLISWNEFSENSYIEPSEKFGMLYLDVLRDIRQAATQ
jgi:copper homeostasis protein CutC